MTHQNRCIRAGDRTDRVGQHLCDCGKRSGA